MTQFRFSSAAALIALAPFAVQAQIEGAQISSDALVSEPTVVECTLTDGSAASCLEITVKYQPDDLEIGPFCPATLEDEGGIWDWDGDEAGLYRVDGEFLKMLDEMGYHFYDEDGTVHVFDIRVEGPTEANECISGSVDEAVEMTMLIPTTPQMADAPVSLGTVAKIGMSLSGVPIFADAPSVLDTGHMPALDVCAGHVDPGGWYHYHGTASDLDTVYEHNNVEGSCANAVQDAKAQFGYAFDGFAIMGSLEHDGSVPRDLDECGGHMDGDTYHYHSTGEFPNLPTCLVGLQAEDNFNTTAAAGIGAAGGPGGGQGGGRPDFEAIASDLGIDAQLLMQTMQDAGGPNADLAAVAANLGVDEADLRAALPQRP
ncbi:YHYH protein [Octadecabacter sp. 1_MG-2023]|uniref:YHYH protein n=1 Tax=unclassified Octadecabacter TaxID=196158 RepID=UPI001C0A5F05|nr:MULTISPECIES: YHYH protein [unclassified Octadecabacter]MBU2991848.1 YHYH protein [Octadecabacter sp. B2R22]MDO6735822.1 YHYH protein [Octadecabacter sp. 1_MG-2023]